MANPTGKGGKKWVKGQSGNAGGPKKKDPVIEAFKETTYKEFIQQLQKYGNFTHAEMTSEIARTDRTMFEKMFGRIIIMAADGDKDARNVLLDRLWGKVKQSVEYTDANAAEREKIRRMSTEELTAFVLEKGKE